MRNNIKINNYIETIESYNKAVEKNNKPMINKMYRQMRKIYYDNYKTLDFLNSLSDILKLRDTSPVVKLWAASHLLGAESHIKESERTLASLAKRKDLGIISFDAEMTLKVWKEQGYLKF